MSRDLRDLHRDVAVLCGDWLRRCNARGVGVLIYCTRRSALEQSRLYAQGRTAPGVIVTNAKAGESFHQYGLAWDAVPLAYSAPDVPKLDWSPFTTKENEPLFRSTGNIQLLDWRWRVLVEAGDAIGLEWAGRWQAFTEYVHWQFTGGMTINDLKRDTGNMT